MPDESFDVFGDGSVVAFPMHGHSAGMTAIRVGTSVLGVLIFREVLNPAQIVCIALIVARISGLKLLS